MKIWEPKAPGTLWATPDLLRDSFTPYRSEQTYISLVLCWLILHTSYQKKKVFIKSNYKIGPSWKFETFPVSVKFESNLDTPFRNTSADIAATPSL